MQQRQDAKIDVLLCSHKILAGLTRRKHASVIVPSDIWHDHEYKHMQWRALQLHHEQTNTLGVPQRADLDWDPRRIPRQLPQEETQEEGEPEMDSSDPVKDFAQF